MKKLTKILMLALVMCCAFVFTACGGGELDTEVKVDTGKEADYVACTAENSLVSKVEAGEVVAPEEFSGLKLTLKANMDTNQGGMPKEVAIDMNLILTASLEEGEELTAADIGMGLKGSIKMTTPLSKEDMEMNISAYLKENVMYINYSMGEEEVKGKVTLEDMMGDADEAPEDFDISQIKEVLEGILASEDLVQKVIENGEDSTYQLELGTTKLYVIVKDNAFNKALITMEDVNVVDLISQFVPEVGEMNIPEITLNELSVAFEFTDSAINYPSFKGYQEITDGLIPGM